MNIGRSGGCDVTFIGRDRREGWVLGEQRGGRAAEQRRFTELPYCKCKASITAKLTHG